MAIASSCSLKIPYLRYERPSLEPINKDNFLYLDSFSTLLAGNYLQNQRVLLTIGYKNLYLFKNQQQQATLFARVIPAVFSIEAAINAGFSGDRLIALRPPVSAALEKALISQWQISLLVTKASGTAGGEEIKRALARELGISLIVVKRPLLTYPQETSSLSQVLAFAYKHYRD